MGNFMARTKKTNLFANIIWPQAEETNASDSIASTIPSKKLKTNLCATIKLSITKETHPHASIIASFI